MAELELREGGDDACAAPLGAPMRWAGEYRDAETGFVYLQARYYDPATAQFLTRDPLEAATRTAYGYAANSALNFTDPSGLAPWDGIVKGIGDFLTGGDCGGGFLGDVGDFVDGVGNALNTIGDIVWT